MNKTGRPWWLTLRWLNPVWLAAYVRVVTRAWVHGLPTSEQEQDLPMPSDMVTLAQAREMAETHAVVALRQFTVIGDGWPDICGPVWLIPKDDYARLVAELTARYGEPEFEGLTSWDESERAGPIGVILRREA